MTQSVPLPPEVTYGYFKPKGYYTQFKQWPITPMSSNQYWTPDQIIRFLITIKSGVMDPYRSHLRLLVTVPLQSSPVGGLQVDNSAQSFIAQTVISSNNVQIERLTEYDTLAAYLTDIGFSQYVCQSRQVQGLGYSNAQSHKPWNQKSYSNGQVTLNNLTPLGNMTWQNTPTNLCSPTRAGSYGSLGGAFMLGVTNQNSTSTMVMGQSPIHPSISNILWQGPGQNITLQQVQNTLGRFNNIRAQYSQAINSPTFPDSNTSLNQGCPIVKNQNYNVSQMTSNSSTSGFNPKNPYQIQFNPINNTSSYITYSGTELPMKIPNTNNLYGYGNPISCQFARGTQQTLLSPTIPQCQMQNGLILPTKVPVSSQIFRLPLISSICGILIPPQQFLLIPIASMYNLLLQITLSRFAMFTTGYSDIHQFDQRGMGMMQQRKWVVSEIQWNLHLYTFSDSEVNKSIQASLSKSIPVSATSYILSAQYQLPNGQVVRNAWPVGSQSESLCQVIAMFLSNQYQQYSFCRKQFRLSNNISSMQIKFNTQFFPSQPIIGNAGNPYILDTTGDNYPFYMQLMLSTNYLFNTNIPLPKINMKNFAINGRIYNPKNTATFYDPNMLTNPNYTWTSNSVNMDTALGMSSFHQNRYVGKAAFVYTWQPYGHSKNYMTGINTQGVQNFSLIFNTTNMGHFPSDQTLLIFTRSNIIVIYDSKGIRVVGN